MAQYSIHESNMPKLLERLKKIENKCKKYNCTFSFSEVGEEYKAVKHDITDGRTKTTIKTTMERFIIVEVEGKAIINDWQFIATLEHTPNGNIIRKADYTASLPEKYNTAKAYCEHCKTNRDRKDTYIIRNTITNEFKQVGKSCLRDYTNGMDAEMIANYLSYFEYLEELNNHESLGGYSRQYINIEEYLLSACEAIKHYGFISKSKAQETDSIPTTTRIYTLLYDRSKYASEERNRINYNPETEENKKQVTEALNWIKAIETNNEYLHNLKMVCLKEYAEFRDCGILASLLPAYYKAMETAKKKQEEQSSKKQSEYVGKVGDKIQKELTLINQFNYETHFSYYGELQSIYIFEDDNNNIYKWTTNKPLEKEIQEGEYITFKQIQKGEKLILKGTIKAHEEYKGQKQTVLTRCKVLG